MKRNLLKIYENFLDDLNDNDININNQNNINNEQDNIDMNDNQDDTDSEQDNIDNKQDNTNVNFVLTEKRNPPVFKAIKFMNNEVYDNILKYNTGQHGYIQDELNKITFLSSDGDYKSYFKKVTNFKELEFFHGLIVILKYSFSGCKKLKTIKFPKELQEIRMSSFQNCFSLKNLVLPENIKLIESCAFWSCIGLETVVIPNIPNIQIPPNTSEEEFEENELSGLHDRAFENCVSLKEITIPKKFQNRMKNIFKGVNLSKVKINYTHVDEVKEKIYNFHDNSNENDFILSPNKNPQFFKDLCKMLKDEKIPFNENGFTQEDLDQITLLTTATEYNNGTKGYFKNVTSLDELQYFHNLKKINWGCFENSKILKSVIFPENIKYILTNSFHNTGIRNLILPDSIKKIYDGSFHYCRFLNNLVLPKNIEEIEYFSFCGCESLTKLNLPNTLKKIGDSAFMNTGIKELILPDSIKEIGDEAFRECELLEKIFIPKIFNFKKEGSCIFRDCVNLKEITIPEKLDFYLEDLFNGVDLSKIKINYI